MASTRFTVLTGHLSQYSLADLLGILRHQRKTGRLLIEYIGSPAILFFKNGNLVDAQYNTLIGVQAIFVAFVQPPAAFNFNPLIQPTRDSIDFEQQRVILELLGCWTEDAIQVSSIPPRDGLSRHDVERPELRSVPAQLVLPPAPLAASTELPEAKTVLALPAGRPKGSLSFRSVRRPWVLAAATFGLLLVFGVPTLIAINSKSGKVSSTPATSQLQLARTGTALPAASVSDTRLPSDKAGADSTSGVVERKRERDQEDQNLAEGEKVSNKVRPDEALKESASVPVPPKELPKPVVSNSEPAQAPKTKQPSTTSQTVRVIMRIENGRVVHATLGDRRPGIEAYEALALRIARQRRYPAGVNKQETMLMKIDAPK